MTSDRYIVATIKSWNIERTKELIANNPELKIDLITDESSLNFKKISKIAPRYIFFPHWSWIISHEIHENFECVVFHMTDLPFGRGGSPLQNLIERGIYKTKISALKVVKELDAGPIYLKHDLELQGSATEIFKQASDIIFGDMIPFIIKNRPEPIPQEGRIVAFKRRRLEQSNIADLASNIKVYDYIRMLDAEGYPPAFVETGDLRIEFFDAKLEDDCVISQVKIKVKDE